LIIQHVSNLSLIGNRTNEVINSVIKCTSLAGIVVAGSSNIVIANIEMNECGNEYESSNAVIAVRNTNDIAFTFIMMNHGGRYILYINGHQRVSYLAVFNSTSVTVLQFCVTSPRKELYMWETDMTFVNVQQNLTLIKLTTSKLNILYHNNSNSEAKTNVNIDQLKIHNIVLDNYKTMNLEILNSSIHLNVRLIKSRITSATALWMICEDYSGYIVIAVKKCNFSNNHSIEIQPPFLPVVNFYCTNSDVHQIKIAFIDCNFVNFTYRVLLFRPLLHISITEMTHNETNKL